MDPNYPGGSIPRNGPPMNNQMRPPPSPGNSSMNLNARPPYPNQRPSGPPVQQQQQQQFQAPQGGRSPMMSPFQKQDPSAAGGHQQYPISPGSHQSAPSPTRPPGMSPGPVPVQRPPLQQQQQQQQPRPHPPAGAQQPMQQFGHPGRPVMAGNQGPVRPGTGSPQSQPTQIMRPPAQGGQHQPPQAAQPLSNGSGLRPSASHPSLSGGGPGMPTTRSPQLRPLQPQPQQQQQQQQQQPGFRPSPSHPNVSQQPGVRPPGQSSPVQPHPPAARPTGPMNQQPRPRPPQMIPQGHGPPQQGNTGSSVQLDIPMFDGGTPNSGVDPTNVRPQQRPPGARPILDQMRQQTSQNQPPQGQQGQMQGQVPQNINPTQRSSQRPPPVQGHPQRPQQLSSPQGPPIDLAKDQPNQQFSGPGAGPQQPHISPGQAAPQRPYVVPGSPGQRPLSGVEVKTPGPAPSAPIRPPAPPAQQPVHHEPTQLKEPDEPLSDTDDNGFDDDDVEGGGIKPPAPTAADKPPPPQASAASGPPAGPPRGPPRKQPASTSTGPARITPPSNNPSSPPPSAFPSAGPRPRVRPPPGNKEFIPYRPPERPSQAPMMYSQTGQPVTQPSFQQPDKPSTEESEATSIVSQGVNATSSGIRPRDGGLQKRVVASDNSASKPTGVSGSNVAAPPSPKFHGHKGPPILNARGKKPSSAMRSLKTWVIRGGLIYLGYTALFNCGPDATGVREYYCKATNGIGNLAKPYVAPHYNTYLGPHVDRYVKPVTRQSHRFYLKVADPAVQRAVSAAGSVYRSTAKKHVDSAKEQIFSILPYPFKSQVLKDSEQAPDNQQDEHEKDQPEVERVSRQPIHVQEPDEPLDDIARLKEDITEDIADEKVPEPLSEAPEQTESDIPQAERVIEEDAKNEETAEGSIGIDSDHATDDARDDKSDEAATEESDITTEQESSDVTSESSSEQVLGSTEETLDQDSITQLEAGETHTQPSAPFAESTAEFLDTPTVVSEEKEQPTTHDELTVESAEGTALPTDVPAPTEEEHVEQIPVVTSESTNDLEGEKHFEHTQQEERSQVTSDGIEEGGEQDDTTVNHEEEHGRQEEEEESISDDLEGDDALHEQQAVPGQETEHEHDEL